MNISQLPDADLIKTFRYICNLCGYPEVNQDKMSTLLDFIRVNHGHNTTDELTDAYRALASARLEEKVDNFKSLNGMSASRVLQAYLRIKRKTDTTSAPGEKGFLSDETKEIILKYNNRPVMYQDDLTPDERKHLMRHWIEENIKNYHFHRRADLLTASSFDFLITEGTIRVKEGLFQKFSGKTYETLCGWDEVEERGKNLKKAEDHQLMKGRADNFRRMMSPSAGGSLHDATKRAAVAVYFDSLT